MNPEKLVTITPLFAPPNPRDIDVLHPLTRQVMTALEKQYSDFIIDSGNNDNDYDHRLTNNLRLSPIPCLENSDQWNDLQITIDTGSRRNQKLIDNSNRNMEQILGKVRETTDNLNLNQTNNNNSESKEGQKNQTTFKKDKEKLDLKQFEFTEKKKNVARISVHTSDPINIQNGDAVTKEIEDSVATDGYNNDDGMNSNGNEVQQTAGKKVTSSAKVSLEQFAFKPRPKNPNALDESNKSNETTFENMITKQVTINVCAQSDKNDKVSYSERGEITFTYVPSDDSSNMSFSQKSVELNLNTKAPNVVIDETPCNQVSAIELLAKKYNECGPIKQIINPNYIQDIKQGNKQIQIDETPQNEQKSALELLADKYDESKLDKSAEQRENQNNCANLVGKDRENIIVDETPQIQRSDLEILVQKHSENHYTYGDYTLVIENPDAKRNVEENTIQGENKPDLIIDETLMCQQMSALDLLAQKYNESGSLQLDNRSERSCTKQTAVTQARSGVNKINKEKTRNKDENLEVHLTTTEDITFDYSSNKSLGSNNAGGNVSTQPENTGPHQVSTLDVYNNCNSVKFNISAQNQKTPMKDNPKIKINKATCPRNVDKKLQKPYSQNAEAQNNFLIEKNKVQNMNKQFNEQNIIDEIPNCMISALELLAQKYNDAVSIKCTQNSKNQNTCTSGDRKQNKETNKQITIAQNTSNKQITIAQNAPNKQVSNSQNVVPKNGNLEKLVYSKSDNHEQNIIVDTRQNKHDNNKKYNKTDHTEMDNVSVQNVESPYENQNTNNVIRKVREKYDDDDLLDKSVSQNPFCNTNNGKKIVADENLETSTKENKTNIATEDKETKTEDCLNQSITLNKIEYIENWIRNLAVQNSKTTEVDQYDEYMDIEYVNDKTNRPRETDDANEKAEEENKENIPPKTTSNNLKSNILNPCTNTENSANKINLKNGDSKCKNETPAPNDLTQNQNAKQIESGTQYVEDWFKDMPEQYSKIKDLFDFDMSTSTDVKSPKLPAQTTEIKPKPLLSPELAQKPRKTKLIQRKTYMLEIDKSKPVPQPKRVQTKITSIFQPVNLDIPKQPLENKQNNAKDELLEDKIVGNKCAPSMLGKRKISDHFKVLKPRAKKAKNEEKEDEIKQENQAPRFIKKKYKYFTPIFSQLPEKEVKYEMYTVDDNMASQMEVYIQENVPYEISFNIIYRNGYCQLSQPKKSVNFDHTATGIMLHVSWLTEKLTKTYFTEFYHINLSKTYWQDFAIPRSLMKTCLTMNCRKISFKAQSLFVLLMDTFSFTAEEVSLNWIALDPYIGCWLLDPDHPPTTFQGVQSQLDTRPKYKVTASDVAVRSCDMLIQLSEATQRLQSRLEERDLWTIFMEMEMKIVSILSVLEHRGISTNVDILKSFSKTLKDKSETVETKAYKIAGRKFQLNSPVQVRVILYDELKLDTTNCIDIKQTSTLGAKSTSEPMLQLLRKVHPLPGLVLEYRHLNKAKSTFVDAMLQHVSNGIIKSTWEQTAAATGRIASSNPNLQAVPKHPFPLVLFPETGDLGGNDSLRLRNAYSARPGYSLLAADFQHIELRVFAHLARDQSITDALNGPGDIFMQMTKCWLGHKVKQITNEHREQTKKIVYATIYGAGPGKLADILSVPQDEAVAILRDFSKQFPSLREFSTATIEQCRIQGYLTSLSGRCRLFPNINSTVFGLKAQSERQAVNFLIQGSAADICKAAMITTEEQLKHLNCKLLLQIHDELVWEVIDSELNQVKCIVKYVMEDTNTMCGKLIKLSVPLPVSISVGKSWGDMK